MTACRGRRWLGEAIMTIWISLGVALLAFAFGVTGLYLQKLLPSQHTSDRSRDMITAIVGLISLSCSRWCWER